MNETVKKMLIGFGVAILFGIICIISMCSETQYEKDYKSSRGKTWSQMTEGEKRVVRDEIEYKIKKDKKSGKWTDD